MDVMITLRNSEYNVPSTKTFLFIIPCNLNYTKALKSWNFIKEYDLNQANSMEEASTSEKVGEFGTFQLSNSRTNNILQCKLILLLEPENDIYTTIDNYYEMYNFNGIITVDNYNSEKTKEKIFSMITQYSLYNVPISKVYV